MNKTKVLLVDDDVLLGKVLVSALNSSGYETHYQTSLTAIRTVIKEWQPDIIVLDVEIGNQSGVEITPQLRLEAPEIPILFISSHTAGIEISQALNAGGIAYIKKPFEVEELLAYIERHVSAYHPATKQIGSFTFNVGEHLLTGSEGTVNKLTLLECKLLKLLALNMNQTVSRETIAQELWDGGHVSIQSLNNQIAKLRKYLSEDNTIELLTIPKEGYKLTVKENEA